MKTLNDENDVVDNSFKKYIESKGRLDVHQKPGPSVHPGAPHGDKESMVGAIFSTTICKNTKENLGVHMRQDNTAIVNPMPSVKRLDCTPMCMK